MRDAGEMHNVVYVGKQPVPVDPFLQIRKASDLNTITRTSRKRIARRRDNMIARPRKRRDDPSSNKT
jgi:hypothetical protein